MLAKRTKNIIIIIVVIVVLGIGGLVYFAMNRLDNVTIDTDTNTNTDLPVNATVGLDEDPTDENTNTNSSTNTNVSTGSLTVNEPISVSGTVFIKGYRTPSESYGVLTTEGFEIGLGKYDSMREQFRAYVGEKVDISFSDVCKTSSEGCCRTLFGFCGTVTDWTPLED